ncbi:MAG: MoaD/ThiS family protein [Oscillospiraceae bacterium]|nr:MoaD/ThiS family protein [Oscillospiraceae bacterium]
MVTVKLFGTLRLDSGVREFTAEAASVKELYPLVLREIRAKKADTAVTERSLRACLVAVNGEQVSPRAKLRDGDLVYLFPAVAGG